MSFSFAFWFVPCPWPSLQYVESGSGMSRVFFGGFELRKSVFWGVLLTAAVFFWGGLLDKCCIFKCFVFLTVFLGAVLYT